MIDGKGLTVSVPRVGTLTVSIRGLLELAVFVILAGSLLLRSWQLDRARKDAGAYALAADTLRASVDRTKRVAVVLDSALEATQRRVVQVAARTDSLDRALGLERIGKAVLVAQIERLTVLANSTAPVQETLEGTRTARFVVDSTPYHVTAAVSLPRAPGRGTIALGVTVDTIGLEARHGCSDPDAAGIRSAFLTVVGPQWAHVRIDRVEQDPSLCRSPALQPAHDDGRPLWRKLIDRVGISTGFGTTIGPSTSGGVTVATGATILAGVKIWP